MTRTTRTRPAGSWPGLRAALRITVAAGAVRWLLLLETSDLLLDVFTGFLALYLVVSVHASPLVAAIGVAVRLGAGLAGYAALTPVLERFSPLRVLRVSVLISGVLFPVFLLVPGIAPKLIALAALSIVTAPWYPVLMAELYSSLPGRSGLAVSLSSAASLAGRGRSAGGRVARPGSGTDLGHGGAVRGAGRDASRAPTSRAPGSERRLG